MEKEEEEEVILIFHRVSTTQMCSWSHVHSSWWPLALDLGPGGSPLVSDSSSPLVAVEGAAVVGEEEAQAVAERQRGFGRRAAAGLRAVELRR